MRKLQSIDKKSSSYKWQNSTQIRWNMNVLACVNKRFKADIGHGWIQGVQEFLSVIIFYFSIFFSVLASFSWKSWLQTDEIAVGISWLKI